MAEPVYSKQQVEQWQQALSVMAQKPRTTFTKKQVVEALIEDIEAALVTRSFREVAAGLAENGLDISEGSLKQYVARYRRSRNKGQAKGQKKADKKQAKKTNKTAKSVADKTGDINQKNEGASKPSAFPLPTGEKSDNFDL